MKILKKIITISIPIILSLPLFGAGWKYVVSTSAPGVCIIKIYDDTKIISIGTGFLISRNGDILTNAHVIKSAYYNEKYKIIVTFEYKDSNPKEYTSTIKAYNADNDLCLLNIQGYFPVFCRLGNSDRADLMDEIIVMGYPLGKSFKITPGHIQSFQEIPGIGKMIDIDVLVDPGNSGGPIFDKSGMVIGIVTSRYEGYNFNFAIPINTAKFYLKNYKTNKSIKITSNPLGARIYINKSYKGVTPLSLNFYYKTFNIVIEKDDYIKTEKNIQVNQIKNSAIHFNLIKKESDSKKVIIKTIPENALVIVDNDVKGDSPVEFNVNGNTTIRIIIKKFGYKKIYKEVKIENNNVTTLEFKLEFGF